MHPIRKFLEPVIRFALPPRCPACGVTVGDDHQLCVACWSKVDFLGDVGCTLCGIPMEREDMMCGPCLVAPPRHDGAKAVVAYDDLTRGLVMRLKYGRRIGLAEGMGKAMARHVGSDATVLLVPVPLHRWRIWSRGFNQSLLLARAISKRTGAAIMLDGLVRTKRTPPLKALGAKDRIKVLRAAFALTPDGKAAIEGREIILIDDVYTSGATANACASVLKKGGAARVTVLAWARVPLPGADGR